MKNYYLAKVIDHSEFGQVVWEGIFASPSLARTTLQAKYELHVSITDEPFKKSIAMELETIDFYG